MRTALFVESRIKRAVDIAGVIAGAALLSPVILAVAIAVALDVGFPLIFSQVRPGRNGRLMVVYKFRSMGARFDAAGRPRTDEQRTSAAGSFLRSTRLDELPQLYNVLKGEMSLVGPRPLLPADQPAAERARLRARPGLTGWAQIHGGREVPPERKAALDRWYVENASLALDARILLRTARMLLARSIDGGTAPKTGAQVGVRTRVSTSSWSLD